MALTKRALASKVTGHKGHSPEQSVTGVSDTSCKADIFCPFLERTFIIDIAVVDPSAPSYIRMVDSHHTVDAAARERERMKMLNFNAAAIDGGQFIPFVVEATGRLGPAARDFLQLVIHKDHEALRDFLGHTSVIIAKLNARSIMTARSKQSYGHPPDLQDERGVR